MDKKFKMERIVGIMATVIHCVGSALLKGTVRRWIGAKTHLDFPSNTLTFQQQLDCPS